MELITILNRCHRFQGFVYRQAAAICSRCHIRLRLTARAASSSFPCGLFSVFLLYAMRGVNCRRCGTVVVEEVPRGDGKRSLTKAYMLLLARWVRRLSWKKPPRPFALRLL